MKKNIILAAVLLALAGGGIWLYLRHKPIAGELSLTGNVEMRQVNLAFHGNERIRDVLVEEGAQVHKGQLLARLETDRLTPLVAQAEGQLAALQAALERLRNGNRPEEIAQGRANLQSAQADALNAQQQYDRQVALRKTAVTSQQLLDQAKAATDVAQAKVHAAQKALDLLVAGARQEDIQQAQAQVHAAEAYLRLLRQQLADTELTSPVDGIISSRLMEPGEMASTTSPVFSIAVSDPKWVRAYVSEPQLGLVRPNMPATVTIDSYPDRPLEGWVGFISPVAEFTPKIVQTEELRSSLVYEVRVLVKDPDNVLRLGMPATIRLPVPEPPALLAGPAKLAAPSKPAASSKPAAAAMPAAPAMPERAQ